MELKNKPAFYFPPANGRYEVSAGLSRLDKDFGNGPLDQQIFQFDNTFQEYRDNKLSCRKEELSKYYVEKDFSKQARKDVNQYLVHQLSREHPDKFITHCQKGTIRLECLLTRETLIFSKDYTLVDTTNLTFEIPYTTSLDALACQIQEDIAVIQLKPDGGDAISALHLCSPNHWAAEDKIGQSFVTAHQPVPRMEKINAQATKLLNVILDSGPYVRFAWGISTDQQLNHHPLALQGTDNRINGRYFDSDRPQLYLRVERQTVKGLAEHGTILFTIRTYHVDILSFVLTDRQLEQLISAINSMDFDTASYKGLGNDKERIIYSLQTLKNK